VRAGKAPGPQGSIAKLRTTQITQTAAEAAFELAGLSGQAWETAQGEKIARTLLAYPGNAIAGGTTDIMKNILGERVLGLPKEPQVDRDVPFRELRSGTVRA
jgi:alkylation response protein AidB-like acyl-CoA dehydrogenase